MNSHSYFTPISTYCRGLATNRKYNYVVCVGGLAWMDELILTALERDTRDQRTSKSFMLLHNPRNRCRLPL